MNVDSSYVASGAGRPRPFTMGSGQAELKPYEPSWAENTQHWVQERLEGLGMGRYQARDLGEKVRTLGEFAPVTGSALSANESKRALDLGQYLLSGIHAIGALPIPGAGKLAEKLGAKGVERLAREEAERLAAKAAEERAAQEAAEAAARRNAQVDGAQGARSTRNARTLWAPRMVNGRRVYQRDDLIDPNLTDSAGRTNLERMRAGKPPVDADGHAIELHHMVQQETIRPQGTMPP